MKLSDEVKSKIYEEYESFKDSLYAGRSLEERRELDQFFTPPELSIEMIDHFDADNLAGKKIIDPTCGSGNFLVACLLAGADADKIFGNEYNQAMVDACRKRIQAVCKKYNIKGFNYWQVHRGNALQPGCLMVFGEEYERGYDVSRIDSLPKGKSPGYAYDQYFLKTDSDDFWNC